MEVNYISQSVHSNLCGQSVISMLLNIPIKVVIEDLVETKDKLRNSDIKKVLDSHQIKNESLRTRHFESIPDTAIVKVAIENSANSYWVLKYKGIFYDPYIGVVSKYNSRVTFPMSYFIIDKFSLSQYEEQMAA